MTAAVQMIEIPSDALDAAKERLATLEGVFGFNEVIAMINGLIDEVDSMPIASRFSSDKEIYSSWGAPADLNPEIKHLTEAEHKRWQLRKDFTKIRMTIILLEHSFKNVFMDMQAAATD